MNVGVSRSGRSMAGASVVVKKELSMKVDYTARAVLFDGLEAGVLGNTFGGKVDSVHACAPGKICVKASSSVAWGFRASFSHTFATTEPTSVLGWKFDPNEIQVEYAASQPAPARDAARQPAAEQRRPPVAMPAPAAAQWRPAPAAEQRRPPVAMPAPAAEQRYSRTSPSNFNGFEAL